MLMGRDMGRQGQVYGFRKLKGWGFSSFRGITSPNNNLFKRKMVPILLSTIVLLKLLKYINSSINYCMKLTMDLAAIKFAFAKKKQPKVVNPLNRNISPEWIS